MYLLRSISCIGNLRWHCVHDAEGGLGLLPFVRVWPCQSIASSSCYCLGTFVQVYHFRWVCCISAACCAIRVLVCDLVLVLKASRPVHPTECTHIAPSIPRTQPCIVQSKGALQGGAVNWPSHSGPNEHTNVCRVRTGQCLFASLEGASWGSLGSMQLLLIFSTCLACATSQRRH
jgi:hypothetical protein